jgi:hypothetical protein
MEGAALVLRGLERAVPEILERAALPFPRLKGAVAAGRRRFVRAVRLAAWLLIPGVTHAPRLAGHRDITGQE